MMQSPMSKARTKISGILIEITAAIGATVAIAIGVPCVACYALIERYKRRCAMSGINRDIDTFLKQNRANTQ